MSISIDRFIAYACDLKCRSIYDIGSRDGADAYLMQSKIQAQDVHIFEPIPDSAECIRRTYPEFNTHQLALSDYDGNATFYAFKMNEPVYERGISSLRDRNDGVYKTNTTLINAEVSRFDTWFEGQKLDTLDCVKVDTEGNTYETLLGFGSLLTKVKILHIEVETYQYWKDQKLKPDVESFLNNAFKKVDEFYCGGYQYDQIWLNRSM